MFSSCLFLSLKLFPGANWTLGFVSDVMILLWKALLSCVHHIQLLFCSSCDKHYEHSPYTSMRNLKEALPGTTYPKPIPAPPVLFLKLHGSIQLSHTGFVQLLKKESQSAWSLFQNAVVSTNNTNFSWDYQYFLFTWFGRTWAQMTLVLDFCVFLFAHQSWE